MNEMVGGTDRGNPKYPEKAVPVPLCPL